jgi:4-amino-4-deoxy-L-arabinose transferase-like glycosyltransferase
MSFGRSQLVPAGGQRDNAAIIAVTLLAALVLLRLWVVTQLGLVADEAYYWMWSKHLAASYTDKGPAIAWIIAAGTGVFGDSPFGIRWLGVLLSAGTGWQIFRLARRLYDERVALWCLVVASLIPLFAVGSIIMTIDSPSVFCWAWAANIFWTALESGKTRHWIGLGLVIGAGFLSKFTNGVQLSCIALFLLWSLPHRRFLFSRQSLALILAFGLCLLPILWWNSQVGWLHAAALHSRSGVQGSFHIRPLQLFRFLGEQLGVISPLLGLGMAVAAFGLLVSHHRDPRVRFLLCQFLPVYGIFTFFSLNYAGKGNWPAPALIPGVLLLVVFWRGLIRDRPGWRWAVPAGVGVAALMTVILQLAVFVPVPVLDGLMNRSRGWPDYAAHIQRARTEYNAPLLIANHYSQASLAQFYLPDHPHVYQVTGRHPQFRLWGGYTLGPGTRALYITSDMKEDLNHLPPQLSKEFPIRELVDDFWTQHKGKDLKRFRLYFLATTEAEPAPPPPAAVSNSPPPSAAP